MCQLVVALPINALLFRLFSLLKKFTRNNRILTNFNYSFSHLPLYSNNYTFMLVICLLSRKWNNIFLIHAQLRYIFTCVPTQRYIFFTWIITPMPFLLADNFRSITDAFNCYAKRTFAFPIMSLGKTLLVKKRRPSCASIIKISNKSFVSVAVTVVVSIAPNTVIQAVQQILYIHSQRTLCFIASVPSWQFASLH